ncbi:prohibitin family protein [Mesorhizobium sp. B2-8-3]|uniref:prohibitin family protein n=1 Tax=Mesorhizobium sp. B2-8-3 TaxID=2589905 RepID=UPI00112A9EA5|nr:prohibitin family protein [Mesorhizobium sp. B2-8-3]TPJ33655.1 prohibitin family protein [Mesorhizobium sp. B2-8-3]
MRFYAAITGLVFAALVALTVLFGSWYTIDEGERGILLTNGSFTSVEGPGLHFKTPWFQSVRKISTRQGNLNWEGTSALLSYSKDQQTASLAVTVTYHVPEGDVKDVYQHYGSIETLLSRTIEQTVPASVKTVFGQYTAVKVIQERGTFNSEIAKAVIEGVNGPIVVDSVQVKNIDFSDAYEQTIEARMMAEVEVQKQNQVLAQEKVKADIAVAQARGRADSLKAEADANAYKLKAEGEASAFKLKAEGEATAAAIEARAKALAANSALVELTKAEKWNGALPVTMQPNAAIPFMNVGKGE